ncbi:MAG: hypothetical protein IKH70_00605, partial [Stomatobaculum sp.]|nr:hypothetical protein [Stomatobaculum sp.]
TMDIILAAAAVLVCAGAMFWLMYFGVLPEWAAAYGMAIRSAVLSALLYSVLKLFSSIADRRACAEIQKDSVYAVRLKHDQQKLISRTLSRQSAREHFVCYAFLLTVLTVLLTLSYVRSGSVSSMIVLAAAAVAGFAVTLISYVKDIVRTASDDGFCTVSDRGIIQAGRVFPFRAKNGDVSRLIRFDDCYAVRFLTPGVLGLMISTDFPLPRGGAVSRDVIGAEEEHVILSALDPARVLTEKGSYRYLPADRTEHAENEEAVPVFEADSSLFLKVLAYLALAAMIGAIVFAALTR